MRQKHPEHTIWNQQHQIALDEVRGNPSGRFADYFFDAKINGRRVEVAPGDGDISHLPPGEQDVVTTNSRVVAAAKRIEDPIEYLGEAYEVIRDRRMRGGTRFEGPENYATGLKLFTDKILEQGYALEGEQAEKAREAISKMMDGFVRIAEKDEPNIVEVTNILSVIRNLPEDMVDKKYSRDILKHTLSVLDQFNDRGLKLVVGAMAKMDTSECGVAAAMTLDLTFRKGSQLERSGDMLASLRAVSGLPHSREAERAFSTLLDIRTNLEVSSNLHELKATSNLLVDIIDRTTKRQDDTLRAKEIVEFIARRSAELYSQLPLQGMDEEQRRSYARIMRNIVNNTKRV